MAEELTDEQVFGTQPKENELSDEEVFGASPTASQAQAPAQAGEWPWRFGITPNTDITRARQWNMPSVTGVMSAFGHAFGEEYTEPLGLASGPVKEGLVKYGVLPGKSSDYNDPRKPFMAFNEAVMLPLAAGLDAIWRTAFSAAPRGLQAAGAEAGIPRDIVALPEAFLGSPHPLGVPKLSEPLPSVKETPVRPPEVKIGDIPQPIDTSVARSVAAKTGIPEVDAVLASPTTEAVINNAVVDRQYDVPYMAGGSVPMEDPTIYVDRHVPRQQTAPRASGPGTVTFDPADAWIIHENVEQHVMEMLTKNGMSDQEAYRVAHFEYAEKAEQAWYRAHDIDQVAAEKEQMSWLPRIQHENPENPPPNLYEKPYPHDSVAGARREAVTEAPPTPQEIARAREIIADNQEQIASPGQIVYHGSPARFTQFSSEFNRTGEGANIIATGHYVAEHPDVAREYAKTVSTRAGGEEASLANQALNRYPDRAAAIEYLRNSEASERRRADIDSWRGEQADKYGRAAQLLEKGYKPPEGNLYQAMLLQPKESFLDYEKPIEEQTTELQAAMGRLRQILKDTKEAEGGVTPQSSFMDKGTVETFMKQLRYDFSEADQPELFTKAGIPGIRFLDQFSRNPPLEFRPLTTEENQVIRDIGYGRAPDVTFEMEQKSPAEAWRKNLEHWKELTKDPERLRVIDKLLASGDLTPVEPAQTSNYVVFNDKDLAITHINGEPLLQVAKDLGIIGDPRPDIAEGKPADAAAASMGGGAGKKPPPPPGAGPPQPPGPPPPQPGANPWRDRFEHFVGKLETPDDVKQLIRNAADEQGEFPAARQGDIKLNHVDDIAQAAGFQPGEINTRGLGRDLKNDKEVGVAMQLMLQLADNMKTAAREVRADASPENLIKLEEAIRRRDLAVEQVVGLRAEWGRTGNVFQQFLRDVKDQESLTKFLKDQDEKRTPDGLKKIADAIDGLDKVGAARFMNDMRNPDWFDKFMFYWVNALISGPVTHAKYALANAAFAGVEAGAVTPIAGAVGAVRRGIFGGREGVYVGEVAPALWGIVAGTPDAVVAAAKAAWNGLQTPLPGQIAQNITPKTAALPFAQRQPIGGVTGTLIGIPSRGATAIHTLFNFLGYRVSMERQAYREAAKNFNPTEGAFWERRQNAIDNPTKEMMNIGIEDGARLTYINELSPAARLLTAAAREFKPIRIIMPFMHIPFNILSRGAEYVPGLNFISKAGRDDLLGVNGAVKQDMAAARLIVGGAVGAWVANMSLNDQITGYGPTDQKERAQWMATGHQPYSIRIGDEWYSYNRFGSIGTMLGLHANLAEVLPHLQPDMEELTKALTMAVHTTGRLMEDEVGMQGLASLIDAIDEPERKGTRFVSSFAGSLLPYSSAQRQIASAMDPEMRETKSVVDGLRYYIPGMRQQLLPKRDWLGAPITNAGYGGDLPIPGLSSVIQHRDATVWAIADEMQQLDLHPAPPQNKIGSIQLPPQMYDEYQALAGGLKRASLERWVNQPGWYNLPDFVRKTAFQNSIRTANETAGTYMKMRHPEIIVKNVENEVNRIQGVKPTKLKD